MKKLLLAALAVVALSGEAHAVCTGPAIMHDFPGTSFNMSLSTNAGDGNCASNTVIVGTLPAFGSTPTVNIGTAPTIAVTGTFWQATQPVSGTFWPYTLGQQVNGASVPVVLTAAQLTTLTPPAAITNYAIETGGNLATLVTDFGAPGATACASDTASCNLNQQMQRVAQRLSTINTTLGTPFQAGGSIGNTSFAATQATAASLNATVVGTGTFATQSAQSGTWNITNISGTVSLPTGASTAALQPTNAAIASTTAGQTGHIVMGAVTTAAPSYTTAQSNPLSLTTAGALRVDGSAVTQPVSLTSTTITGTVASTQSGTWNIGTVTTLPALVAGSAIIGKVGIDQTTPGTTNLVSIGTNGTVNPTTAANWGIGTATQNSASVANGHLMLGQFNTSPTTITSGNMSPIQMDNAGNIKVNIAAGASSGAVAQASTTSGQTGGLTQAAVTTAAPTYTTATTNPLSMDTSGNLRVAVASAIGLAQGSTTSGQTGSMIMGAVTTASPTYTTAQTSPLSLDTAGSLRVAIVSGGGSGGTASSFGSAFPATGTAIGLTNGTNMVAWSATSNYGSAPSAIAVPAVNAAVTNTVTVTATNLSTNTAQINGVTPLMGNGATGTGSLRVTLASDSSAIAGKGEGATGSAVPAGAQLAGARSGANMVALIQADTSVAVSMSTATTTQLVALSGATKIYVTAYGVIAGGTGNFTLVYGTGTNCGTGTTALTGAYNLTAQAGIAIGSGMGPVLVVPSGQALCATSSAAVQMSGQVAYTQF